MSFFGKKKKEGEGKKQFLAKYNLNDKIGTGQYASVYYATLIESSKEVFAVKVIKKSKLKRQEDIEGLKSEIRILRGIDFAGIIKLYDVFQGPSEWYLVTELAQGGDLFERVLASAFSEKDTSYIVIQIAEALKYIHDRNIVHRDLKPENILFKDKISNQIKLADFGFAAYCHTPLTDGCGTLVYVAPEILRVMPYHTSPDMWSLGIITYILLSGYPPFYHNNQEKMVKKILRGRYRFRPEEFDRVSVEGKNFIRGLLKRDPTKRMMIEDVFTHPWITNYAKLSDESLNINQKLRKFKAEMLLKRALLAIQAVEKWKRIAEAFTDEGVEDDADED